MNFGSTMSSFSGSNTTSTGMPMRDLIGCAVDQIADHEHALVECGRR